MSLKPPRTRPPEVVLDVHGRQDLAPGFRRYEYCAGHCGWLIGCGDAIDTIWHQSCWDKAHPEQSDGSEVGDAP
jgi:hypothetical protein